MSNQLENILNSNFILKIDSDLVEISKSDKIAVLDFLQEQEIPIANETFYDGCKKLYKNELYLSFTR